MNRPRLIELVSMLIAICAERANAQRGAFRRAIRLCKDAEAQGHESPNGYRGETIERDVAQRSLRQAERYT